MKLFYKILISLILIVVVFVGFLIYRYPYLIHLKKYAENPYVFYMDKKHLSEFDFFKTTHYSSYADNYRLMSDASTKKCPFYLTPDEPDNRGIIVSDRHMLFENNTDYHTNQRDYVKNLIPDSLETMNRIVSWFDNNPDTDLNHNDFERMIYFALFSQVLSPTDADLLLQYRKSARKIALIPPFIRKLFMGDDLEKVESIGNHFIEKFTNDGFEYPEILFDVLWFNGLPIYKMYHIGIDNLLSRSHLISKIINEEKEREYIKEIFRLFPAVRSIPYNVDGKYYAANISLANVDSLVFENPLEIDLNREQYNYLTFAAPSNRHCLGEEFTLNILSYLIKKYTQNNPAV